MPPGSEQPAASPLSRRPRHERARALRAPPGQPDPERRRLAVSRERRLQSGGGYLRRRDRVARARRRPTRDLTPHGRPLGERRRRMDDRARAAARPRRRDRKRAMGIRGRADRVAGRARTLGDHLHRLRACRAGRLSGYDGGLQDRRAPRHGQAPRGQERRAPAAPDRRPLGAAPPSQDRVRPARSFSPARRTSSAGALPSRCSNPVPAPGGTRCGSASARRRSAPSTAGCSSTTASRTPWPETCIAWASRCSTSTSRPASSAAFRPGSSRRSRTTSEQATSPMPSFPAAFSTTQASDEIRLYYGAADSSICLATARLRDLIEAVLAAPRET